MITAGQRERGVAPRHRLDQPERALDQREREVLPHVAEPAARDLLGDPDAEDHDHRGGRVARERPDHHAEHAAQDGRDGDVGRHQRPGFAEVERQPLGAHDGLPEGGGDRGHDEPDDEPDQRVGDELGHQDALPSRAGEEALGDRAVAVLAGRGVGAEHGEEQHGRVADRDDCVAQLGGGAEVLVARIAHGETGGQERDEEQAGGRPGSAAKGAELHELRTDEGDHAATSRSGVDVRSKKTSSRFEDASAISWRTTP